MPEPNSQIHVLFLPLWYPNKYDPMPGLFIERHAQSVSQYCDVSVLYLHPGHNQKEKYQFDVNEDNGIYTIRVYYKQTKNNIPGVSQLIKSIKFFTSAFKGYKYLCSHKYKPQIVHVNVLTRLGVFALFLKLLYGLPFIITEHWSRYQPHVGTYKGIMRKILTKLVVKKASAVTTVDEELKNAMEFHKLTNRNFYITPNVVDTNLFIPAIEKKQRDKKQIINVSCFDDKAKNISGILRIINELSRIRQDFVCYLIGEGPDLNALMQYAKELEINNEFVQFVGLKEGKDLVEIINQSDLMLMFSNYETFSVVVNESFSCGIPVISTSVGGITKRINSERGILTKPSDENEMLIKLNEMLDDIDKYNPKKLRQYIVDHFSYEVIGRQFYDIYMKVLN